MEFDLGDEEMRARLLELPTGNVADNNPHGGVMDAGIKPVDPSFKVLGPAFTVQCVPGDNLALHRGLNAARPGDVAVFACDGFTGGGHLGDMMARACRARGLAGVVIDGACRDANDIRELGYPVFSRGMCPAPTTKAALGELAVPVVAGGVRVRPGDVIFGDCDGVVVIPQEEAGEVFERALAKHEKEGRLAGQIDAGASTLELYGFDAVIRELERAQGE